jgi:tRNA (mo5U34)-methyltransferase
VLDIGAFDGYFSFAAERAGAARVVALDHFAWSIDFEIAQRTGKDSSPAIEVSADAWNPDVLPGKRGFDLAHRALRSRVEIVAGDFMEIDLDEVGRFDVVLLLGVLYHMRHPLLALERVARVTASLAVIESETIAVEGLSADPWCLFVEGRDDNDDRLNWWIPTQAAITSLCRAAGFDRAETLTPQPTVGEPSRRFRYRSVTHAFRS